jgi:hypothetical protein
MFEFTRLVSHARSRGGRTSLRAAARSGCAAIALLACALAAAAGADGATLRTVVRGLDNPRGLAFLPDGRLVVAEGGHGGPVCVAPGNCIGLTGKVVAIDLGNGHRATLASGFPSLGGPFAPFGLGGVTVQRGRLYAIEGVNPQAFGSPTADCMG